MEIIAYLLFLLANHWILTLVVSILTVIGGFGWFAFAWSRLKGEPTEKGERPISKPLAAVVVGAFFLAIAAFVFAIVNMIFPHILDGQLIMSIGKTADARVTRIEPTNSYLNKSRVMRHHIIFKTDSGNYETYFETWDFNVYPSDNSVTYPGQGAAFRVAYLPSFPSAFLILTEEDSEFSRSSACREAQKAFAEASVKFQFDQSDPEFSRQFYEALENLKKLECPGVTVETKTEAIPSTSK